MTALSGSASLSITAASEGVGTFGYDTTWAVGRGEEGLELSINETTRLVLSISAISASGSANPRTTWELRNNNGSQVVIRAQTPGDGVPEDFDVILQPGQYRISANVVGVAEVNSVCGCSSLDGTAALTWSAEFQRP